jgi:tetratricopeptide (TPR) repeat protein
MPKSRTELLQEFLQQDPNDSFSRYALALEHLKYGRLAEGIAEFETLLGRDPDYLATYYHLGKTLEKIGQSQKAVALYKSGIQKAIQKADAHALKELREALIFLTGGDDDDDD